ncbi:CoA transferase [Paenibacillus naphthalenovorans]|uniref:CaiB/BaiF CoA transferase family protein n=1 Tax=Paenibacillus naphthalenovorans TaxID=162209 RepID=UPI0010B5D257|nr:CoA transferase [Paenibacillus naphthalenovorans]GCL71882.1 CoA transferase [Paenibacillus naphthalenovorans]
MLPLHGMKVLDLTQFLAGPYCTLILADLGAEVTKVERFPGGDDSRRVGPFKNGEGYCFAMPNRNKRSIALDLKNEKGKHIFMKLAEKADVVIENFRPDVKTKMGIDYNAVKAVNPGVIYCSISGYGQTGPYSQKGGFDIVAQGVTGLMRMTGEPGGRPVKVGIAINDISAGITAAYGILGAYIHKLKTGEGQYLETSLVDAALAWTFWESAAYFGAGEIPAATGARHRRSTPYQAYKTKDGYVTIGAGNDKLWTNLCNKVLGKPEWVGDPRFIDLQTRMKNIDLLESMIEEILKEQPTSHWVEKLDESGVPGGPVYTYEQALNDPHILARDMVLEIHHPILGDMKTIGFPVKYSGTPLSIRTPAPWLGQHTNEVLNELGLQEEEIKELYNENVVYNKYPERMII